MIPRQNFQMACDAMTVMEMADTNKPRTAFDVQFAMLTDP